MILTKERNTVDIKSNTIEGVNSLFKFSLYLSHSVLYPPTECNMKPETFSTTVSLVCKTTTKWISSNIMAMQ